MCHGPPLGVPERRALRKPHVSAILTGSVDQPAGSRIQRALPAVSADCSKVGRWVDEVHQDAPYIFDPFRVVVVLDGLARWRRPPSAVWPPAMILQPFRLQVVHQDAPYICMAALRMAMAPGHSSPVENRCDTAARRGFAVPGGLNRCIEMHPISAWPRFAWPWHPAAYRSDTGATRGERNEQSVHG